VARDFLACSWKEGGKEVVRDRIEMFLDYPFELRSSGDLDPSRDLLPVRSPLLLSFSPASLLTPAGRYCEEDRLSSPRRHITGRAWLWR
jgi:hypothetical protein